MKTFIYEVKYKVAIKGNNNTEASRRLHNMKFPNTKNLSYIEDSFDPYLMESFSDKIPKFSKRNYITIFENKELKTSLGIAVKCSGAIEKSGYIADLYVFHTYENKYLAEDRVFMRGVGKVLKGLGFKGSTSLRGELSMQQYGVVVIEPDKKLQKFFIDKFGWEEKSIK